MKKEVDIEEKLKKIAHLKDMNPPLYKIFLTQLGMDIKGNSFVFEYITKVTKQPTLWISFNTVYNDIHTGKKAFSSIEHKDYLNPKHTDTNARKEFLEFMKTNFPDTKIVMVFDLVKIGFIKYQYLGSLMIDTPQNSEVYNALIKKYGNPYSKEKENNKALWIMDYEKALKLNEKNEKFFENI
ncbi:hypothetical protein O8C76_02410 [Aliarcobacter butzleri]|uniref:Uncharacterized protein n=1 Tax=Aliarcobacter butzleri TaxID=28197 RepID=A0AAW7PWP2_9BACT|nr:hypothetical protein [Aliarcobacter butzleri]MDN5069880.1 hypothetical protein [Aliarcobacter butzleri]